MLFSLHDTTQFVVEQAWPKARNISMQHLATLLHDVATCVEWTGQTHATYRKRVAKRMQHAVPNNVARCCVEMLRAFGQALKNMLRTFSGSSCKKIRAFSL